MSHLEDTLVFQLKAARLPEPEREYHFAKPRRFRFDLAWPERKVYAEVEGGTWIQGRHSRGKGIESDCVKYNLAALGGWTGYRFTTDMITRGDALKTLELALS